MTEPKAPAPGVRVADRYRLELRQTGWGAGDVFRAVDLGGGGARVCVKFLPPGDEGDDEHAERFRAHAARLSALRHPNVLPVIDHGTHGAQPFLVTEYHAGESLRVHLDRLAAAKKPGPPAAARAFLDGVAAGVRAAHREAAGGPLVHGALSPDSVRLRANASRGAEPDVLVTDVGLWTLFPEEESLRRAASPEQRSAAGEATPASDVFALGLLLIELLVPGARARPEFAVLARGITPTRADEGRAMLTGLRGDVYASVWGTVARALSRMPEMRHADAGRLLDALSAARWEPRPEGEHDDEPLSDTPSARPLPAATDTPEGGDASTPQGVHARSDVPPAPPAGEPSPEAELDAHPTTPPPASAPNAAEPREFTDESLAPPANAGEAPITERPPPPDAPRSAPPLPPAASAPWTADDTTIEAHAPPPDPTLSETADDPPPAAAPSTPRGEPGGEITHVALEAPPPDHRYSSTHVGPAPRDPDAGDEPVVMEPLAYLRWCLSHPATADERSRRIARFYALVNDRDRWLEASRALLDLAGRIAGAGDRETEFEVWSRLAEIYTGPLHNPRAAADALRVALRLRPDHAGTVRALRELQRAARDTEAHAARLREEFARDPSDAGALLALCEAYEREGMLDGAFCAAAAATLLLGAQAPERVRAIFRQLRPKRLLFPRSAIDRGQFADLLQHPDAIPAVGALFAALLPALLAVLAAPPESELRPDDERCDPTIAATPPVRALDLAARMYDLADPPIIVARKQQSEGLLHLATEPPAVALGAPMLRGVTSAELRFLAARHLLDCLPEFRARALCRARNDDPAAYAFAAIGLASPGAESFAPTPRVLTARDALRAYFSHAPAHWPPVERAARALLAAPAPPDLARWSNAADLTGYRAGLLLAGDLPSCARVLATPGTPPDALRDLLVYSVSDAHFRLREELGLAVGA